MTRDEIIQAAKDAASTHTGPLSRSDFQRITGIGQHHIYQHFPEGGWSEVKALAGLERHPKDNQPLSDDQLLEEFHRVANNLGELPTWAMFSHLADVSADVVRRRFGGLQGTVKRYREWLLEHEPGSALLQMLRVESKQEQEVSRSAASDAVVAGPAPQWTQVDGQQYGAPLSFRGLRHAPINEQGVVFLFGMVSYELGYVVEAFNAVGLDCDAKRCIDAARDRWQKVTIEFEYQSRNFRDHGHDPATCDLVVCWDHNWPECPIEVLELRRVIDELAE